MFGGETFEFNPWMAIAGGFCISLVGSLFGVGGGFLVTPFLASALLLPMFIVVGTKSYSIDGSTCDQCDGVFRAGRARRLAS